MVTFKHALKPGQTENLRLLPCSRCPKAPRGARHHQNINGAHVSFQTCLEMLLGRSQKAPRWAGEPKPRHFRVLLQRHSRRLHLWPSPEAPVRLRVSNLATQGQQKTTTSTAARGEASTPSPARGHRTGTLGVGQGVPRIKKIKQRSSSQGNPGWKFPSAGPPSSPPSHLSPWFHAHSSCKSFPCPARPLLCP